MLSTNHVGNHGHGTIERQANVLPASLLCDGVHHPYNPGRTIGSCNVHHLINTQHEYRQTANTVYTKVRACVSGCINAMHYCGIGASPCQVEWALYIHMAA